MAAVMRAAVLKGKENNGTDDTVRLFYVEKLEVYPSFPKALLNHDCQLDGKAYIVKGNDLYPTLICCAKVTPLPCLLQCLHPIMMICEVSDPFHRFLVLCLSQQFQGHMSYQHVLQSV